MKTDEITTPNYFIHGQTETPYHHTGETGTRQIISSYLERAERQRRILNITSTAQNETQFALSLSLQFWNE